VTQTRRAHSSHAALQAGIQDYLNALPTSTPAKKPFRRFGGQSQLHVMDSYEELGEEEDEAEKDGSRGQASLFAVVSMEIAAEQERMSTDLDLVNQLEDLVVAANDDAQRAQLHALIAGRTGNMQCYVCGEKGHIGRNCKKAGSAGGNDAAYKKWLAEEADRRMKNAEHRASTAPPGFIHRPRETPEGAGAQGRGNGRP
jgi:hypothetical protein